MNKAIKQYYKACEEVRKTFLKTYYAECPEYLDDSDWVADDIGSVLMVGDDFWSLNNMVTALRLEAKEDDLFAWYHSSVDAGVENKPYYNLENYLKYFKDETAN